MIAIIVDNKDHIFSIQGEINKMNVKTIREYIESLLDKCSNLIMNIDMVSKIDLDGLQMLRSIDQKSKQLGKGFTITGIGCKDIYEDFLKTV